MSKVKVEKERRLSPWRVLLGIFVLALASASSVYGLRQWHASESAVSTQPWFASYVDVTATPSYAFEDSADGAKHDAVLSFIVSSKKDSCTPSWGSSYTMDQAGDSLDLDRRIERFRQQGGSIAISFGGLNNHELAVGCTDPDKLLNAYRSVIERYQVNTIDLDIEGQDLTNVSANTMRAQAIAKLQAEQKAAGKSLAVWLTLPVTTQGLAQSGTDAIASTLKGGVDVAGINAMTMDYGATYDKNQTMAQASESALSQTHRQLGVLYKQAGLYLNDATLWSKIGATPMIGQNDDEGQVFTMNDAQAFNDFASSKRIGRMSMWSANRDKTCGSNYVDVTVVSDSCSGIDQHGKTFASILSDTFGGDLSASAGKTTKADSLSADQQKPDDLKTSPYQIWSEDGAYLEGTKVVWHHNVYQAKWWTQNDVPDDPVLQSWETPWTLVGPVLPGEKPIKQATLPEGTYPDWNGSDTYEAQSRVLFSGVPYQAKWWNKGESPAAASSNPTSSPWTPLTQDQINEVESAR